MTAWFDPRTPAFRGRRFVLLVALLVLVAGCSRPAPNVLLITVDTLRADHVGAYGYAPAHTPVMDRLASEGLLFENAITAAPITMPAHASIMTGLLPPAHGVRDNGAYVLSAQAQTLAEVLAAAGYDTAAFVSAVVLSKRYGIDQGFAHYDDTLWTEADPKLFMIRERRAERTVERALNWLDEREGKNENRPFFAWVHLFDPHQPYQAPALETTRTVSPYDAEISYADGALGGLIEHLKLTGQLDNTLIVLTADHGESLGEHQERTHAIFIYRATTHVPLIMRFPRMFDAASRYPGPVRSIDIMPTVLAIVGLGPPEGMQGQDLLPLLGNPDAAPDLPQYSESLVSELGFGMAPLIGVRSKGHTWIRAPRNELYDLQNDPDERVNLHPRPGTEVLSDNLDAALEDLLDDSKARALASVANPLSQETMETLQSLGYLQGAQDRAGVAGMDPKDGIEVYNQLEEARHLAQRENWPEAEAILRKILDRIPGHTSARGVLALALLQQRRFAESESEYLKLIQADPSQFRIYGMLGLVALRAGDLDAAQRHYQTALTLSPDFVEGVTQLALIAMLRDDNATAETLLDQARKLDPDFPPIYRRLGDMLYDRGDFSGALRHYETALKLQPLDLRALVQAGNSARRLDDVPAALDYFERARNADRGHWVASYNRACLLAVSGQVDAAWAALDEAIERGLKQVDLLENDPDWDGLRADMRYHQRIKAMRAAQAD